MLHDTHNEIVGHAGNHIMRKSNKFSINYLIEIEDEITESLSILNISTTFVVIYEPSILLSNNFSWK